MRALPVLSLMLLLASPALGSTTLRVRVGGEPVSLDDPGAEAARIAEQWGEERIAFALGGRLVERTRASLGGRIDVDRLRGWLEAAADPEAPMHDHFEGHTLSLRLPVSLDAEVALGWLTELKREHDRDPRDASLDPETGELTPESVGRTVDAWTTMDRLDEALRAGEESFEIAVHRVAARRTAEDLEGVDVRALMGEYETPYDGSGRSAQRTHNLRVAAEKIDGLVLLPGEVFDFNEVVGERSLANGFRPAPVIAGGELVDGVGGGACQIAGTLHAAVFFAGLEVLERSPHSRPSSYILLGLDAAVSYPNINFRFRNTASFPVQVRLTVAGGQTRAEIRGAERRDEVRFIRRIDEYQAFEERENEDSDLPRGVRVLSQRGVPGFTVTRIRVRRDPETNVAVRERTEDSYPPTTQVWRVGVGGVAPEGYEPPTGDTHGEYRADEYMVVTQGVGVEGTDIIRRAGRTGAPGWTRRAGMPQVD